MGFMMSLTVQLLQLFKEKNDLIANIPETISNIKDLIYNGQVSWLIIKPKLDRYKLIINIAICYTDNKKEILKITIYFRRKQHE